ncbi:LysR family transcriptional regulator [Streptomyces sp. NPDC057617]|uniref:LysR family transcriptional regulator n=1 Tax=Streptomyces sp. NPDC057617 TaxID=3346184 RepID=UPI0036D200F7
MTADFGAYAVNPQPTQKALTDIRAISGRVLADLPMPYLADLVPSDLVTAHLTPDPVSQLTDRAGERPGFMSPPRAVSTAVAVTIALHVLDQRDVPQAGETMRVLLEAMREELWQISASIDSWGRGLTPVLQGVHLAALAPTLRPSEQLRYRTVTPLPSRPRTTGRATARRARKIPSTFWPSWAVPLTPPDGIYPRVLAPVLASSLLIIGSNITLDDAADHLGAVIDGTEISRVFQVLDDHPCWPTMTTALVRVAEYLDAVDVPIDYRRRRRLDYTELLPYERWREICRSTGTSPDTGRREMVARCELFHRISGLPTEVAPGYLGINEAQFRAVSARYAALQTPQLAQALTEEARNFLASHGIHREPVTWQPPLTLLTGLDLPGPDPGQIDVPRLHQLIRQRKNPVQHAAEAFGTSVEAIRLILQEQPAPALPPTKTAARATGHTRYKARLKVPRETFTRLYVDEHRSLPQIAELTGFSRKVLIDLAREYGVPLRNGAQDYKRRGPVDRDWLFEQYVVRLRTLPDLACEKGMSTANMARWAKTHNVPLRSRGGASHDLALRAIDDASRAPRILRPALSGQGAFERLSRFAAAAAYPSLGAAATGLSLNAFTFVAQINRIERELGGLLLTRAERGRPMALTPLGKKVLRAVRTLQRGAQS